MSTRLKSIGSLGPWKSSREKLREPKRSTKVPDYLVLHETQQKTVRRGGKIMNVPAGPARDIYPEPSIIDKNVCTMGKKNELRPGCHVELIFAGNKHAAGLGVKPGAYLRLCQTVNQTDAPLVRVSNHREAQRVSKAYCACKKTSPKSGDGAACVRTAQAKTGHILRGKR